MRQVVRSLDFPLRSPTTPRHLDPAQLHGTGSDYDTDWSRRFPARLARFAIVEGVWRPIVAYYASPQRRGADRLAGLRGPAIFASNHASHADTPLLLTSIPEPWRHRVMVAAAADYFFGSRAGGFLAALGIGAIPIERQRVSRTATQLPIDLLDDGWSLLIYPEGGRSKDGWGQPFRPGVAYVAKQANVPVVPVHVEGTRGILRKGRFVPQRSRSRVTFGSPMWFGDDDTNRTFTARLQATVEALADEGTTDWWTARRRAHAGTSPALTGPDAPHWRRRWALDERRPSPRRRRWPKV